MRVYRISCNGCKWETPMPVDARVAQEFKKQKYCKHCLEHYQQQVPYTIRETIVTGPYLPHRSGGE